MHFRLFKIFMCERPNSEKWNKIKQKHNNWEKRMDKEKKVKQGSVMWMSLFKEMYLLSVWLHF